MKIKKIRKFITVFFLGIMLLIGGCAAQTSTTHPATSLPATTPPAQTTAAATAPASKPAATTVAPSSPKPAATTPAVSPTAKRKQYSSPPAMTIDKTKKYTATMNTTLGSFKIELLASESPLAVNNFVFLSREGFYNGVIFHRIIKTFMVQSGDPTGTGMGGPGYKFADELPPKHSYEAGIVAMANSGPNTNGSQFFICTGADSKSLDKNPNYTQFGKISEGMDIVTKIASVFVGPTNSGEVSKPMTPPVINSITITEE